MIKRTAFSVGATLLVKGQEPRKVDIVVHVPGRTDKLLAFTREHPTARIVR